MARTEFNPGRKFNRVLRKTQQLRPVLLKWGMLGVEASQNAFDQQRYGTSEWAPRAVPNVYGLIADFADGRNPPGRRLESRPALKDTGNLSRSINYMVSGNSVRIGTAVEYARRLHEGGPIESRKITEKVQRNAAKYIKNQSEQVQKRLQFITSPERLGSRLSGQVEARPFVGATPELESQFSRVLRDHIQE